MATRKQNVIAIVRCVFDGNPDRKRLAGYNPEDTKGIVRGTVWLDKTSLESDDLPAAIDVTVTEAT